MNNLRTSPIFKKKYVKIFSFIYLISLIISFILYSKLNNPTILDNIKNITQYLNTNHINFIFNHLIIISIFLISSIFLIGIIIFPLYFLFELITINFNLIVLFNIYKLKGLIFGFIYTFLTKFIYLIFILLIYKKLIKILKQFISKNSSDSLTIFLKKNIISIFIYLIIIFLNDLLIYLFLTKILSKLLFIIT